MRANTETDFWNHVKADVDDDCWEWQLSCRNNGYGQFRFQRRHRSAHRLAWEFTYGVIQDGLFVLHGCDNRKCCRPTHLFLGTQKENIRDMIRKGRRAPYIGGGLQGEAHGCAKLTESEVVSIRSVLTLKSKTQCELAAIYGVSQSMISLIKQNKNWRHSYASA